MAHLSDGTTQDVTSGTQWTLSNSALAKLSNGTVTAVAPGSLTVQAAYVEVAPAGSSPSAATTSPVNLSGSTQVTITAAGTSNTPTITWNTPAPIAYGTALSNAQLNATASVPGTFAYTPAAGAMLSIGTQTLAVTFTPSDTKTYSAAAATVQLTVTQATPVITWAAPAAIQPGTALTAAQLNATASVPGSFAYSPAAGTVLPSGVQQLTAVFTPTDAVNYAAVTTHNSITVGTSTPAPTGPVVNVNPGMSQQALQAAITGAAKGSTILFAAGTYNITSAIGVPCANNLTLTGPIATPATAILAATYSNSTIFQLDNCTGVTIQYLHFENTQAIYMGVEANSGVSILHNQITNLHGTSGIMIDGFLATSVVNGTLQNLVSNTVIEYNTIGDAGSCTAEFAVADDDGNCAGISTHVGEFLNLTIEYNYIYHVSEGIHLEQLTTFNPGATSASCDACKIDYNYILNYHRIGFENQIGAVNTPIYVEHNVVDEPINAFYGTFAMSMACCVSGMIQNGYTGFSPSLYYNDNVTISSGAGGPGHPPYAIEWWGTGSQGLNSLVQGNFSNGYTYGYGDAPWALNNNYICGPYMATEGGYMSNEEGVTPGPSESGNITSTSCTTTASVAPTISPASGSSSTPVTVTLADSGQNTSIYYTTDGSAPVPGSGSTQLYSAPFQVSAPVTVKAVGMWGVAPEPLTYPAGYGYVPSGVVSASYTSGSKVMRPAAKVSSPGSSAAGQTENATPAAGSGQATATLNSVTIVPSAPVTTIGGTTQLKAVALFSDGSTRDVTTDFAWQSSDMRTIAVSSSGMVSGLADGKAVLSGYYQGQQASVSASSTVGEVDWSGPIVITQAGTYSGNWQSTDPKTSAVTIKTTAPVVIQDSHIRGSSDLINANIEGADVTVRNSIGLALNASVKGQPNGVFLNAASPARLDVENNYMENVRDGVWVHGYSGSRDATQTLVIRANRARNLNGLLSDGKGGYLPGEGANRTSSRFVEFDDVQSVPGVDVGWNEVIDYPTRSLVSDVIDVYRSSGTPNHMLEVHDTYVQGAYPYKPAQDAYDGGGIKTDGAADDTSQNASAFTYIHDNQVVGTVSYGIAFTAGHDNTAANNRVISSGLLADGTKIAAQQVGLSNADMHGNMAHGSIYNNTMHDNLIGWTCWTSSCAGAGYRQDQYFPAAPGDYSSNSVVSAKQITLQMEEGEYMLWLSKTTAAGIKVGPSF